MSSNNVYCRDFPDETCRTPSSSAVLLSARYRRPGPVPLRLAGSTFLSFPANGTDQHTYTECSPPTTSASPRPRTGSTVLHLARASTTRPYPCSARPGLEHGSPRPEADRHLLRLLDGVVADGPQDPRPIPIRRTRAVINRSLLAFPGRSGGHGHRMCCAWRARCPRYVPLREPAGCVARAPAPSIALLAALDCPPCSRPPWQSGDARNTESSGSASSSGCTRTYTRMAAPRALRRSPRRDTVQSLAGRGGSTPSRAPTPSGRALLATSLFGMLCRILDSECCAPPPRRGRSCCSRPCEPPPPQLSGRVPPGRVLLSLR